MEKKLAKSSVEDILELTPFQEGLLIHHLKNKTSQYTEQLYLKLTGYIDLAFFEKVWQNITDEHEVLRSFFRWESLKKPVVIVLKKYLPQVEFFDLSFYQGERLDLEILRIRKDDIGEGFDLSQVPFRIKLLKIQREKYIMLISNHHILFDGWSTGIILKEFFRHFDTRTAEETDLLEVKKARFKDYVIWNKQQENKEEAFFWKNYLKDYSGKSGLPFSNFAKVNKILKFEGKRTHTFKVDELLFNNIKQYSKDNKITLANIVYCVWGLLLCKFNENDVVLGTTVSCRPKTIVGIENTVGLFINTIPLMIKNEPEQKLRKILSSAQNELNEREQFDTSSITDICEFIGDDKGSLFDSIVVIENYPIDQVLIENSSSLKIEDHHMDYLTHYLLSVVVSTYNGIHVTFTYNEEIFNKDAILRIEAYFLHILNEVVNYPDKKLLEVKLISEKQWKDLILPSKNLPIEKISKTICELVEDQVSLSPQNPAVQDENMVLSFQELNEKANYLAESLIKSGVKPKDSVILFFDPSVELVINILAILKCQASFLPLSPETPTERLGFIVEDSHSKMICAHPKFKAKLDKRPKVIDILYVSCKSLKNRTDNFSEKGSPNDLAYIIYTSGTTGAPKGVMVENASLANYMQTAVSTYIGDEKVSFPLFTSPAFDLTLTSIFAPLISGNQLIVYDGKQKDFLIETVFDDNRVDIVKLTPSHLKLLKEKFTTSAEKFRNGNKSRIKRFIVGGENLTTKLAHEITELYQGEVEIYNEYGPTEATIGCMIYKYQFGKDNSVSVPIGKALANNWIYILNENLEPVSDGVVGDIYVTGLGLARGYINNRKLTKEKFIVNPYSPSTKMYKTGDLARRLVDGNIEYLGRNDRQVKIRGYRIELEEIEGKLLEFGQKSEEEDNFDIVLSTKKLGTLKRCAKCLLPENYPSISFNEDGVCNVCDEFEKYKPQIESYFRKEHHFKEVAYAMKSRGENYDCLLLYSGGKDSTYVLYKLIDYGLKVLTYTFDNGYISETAFKNIEATTKKLGVKHIAVSSKNMRKVFSESLRSNCSSCHGCWHAINTFGIQIAKRNNINHIVSGLSRGQIYDMRLQGIFETRVFDEHKIEQQLSVFRRSFHSEENRYSKLLKISLTDNTLEGMQFVDFFRYYNTPIRDIRSYLLSKGWIQPKDTGFCSSNCLINDIGIYTHIKEKGYNFYTAPLSWDVRLGQTSREEGIEEITSFGSTEKHVKTVLKEIEYSKVTTIQEAVVIKNDDESKETLTAYLVSDLPPNVSEIRTFLRQRLPEYMIPSHFIQIDKMPLTSNGKLDRALLPMLSANRPKLQNEYIVPTTSIELKITEICKEVLGLETVGVNDNLFDLGSTSYDLTRITNKLNEAFEKKINVTSLFELTTVHALARYYSQDTNQKQSNVSDKSNTDLSVADNKLKLRRAMLNENN